VAKAVAAAGGEGVATARGDGAAASGFASGSIARGAVGGGESSGVRMVSTESRRSRKRFLKEPPDGTSTALGPSVDLTSLKISFWRCAVSDDEGWLDGDVVGDAEPSRARAASNCCRSNTVGFLDAPRGLTAFVNTLSTLDVLRRRKLDVGDAEGEVVALPLQSMDCMRALMASAAFGDVLKRSLMPGERTSAMEW
jgi:hypothetical protein